MGSFQFASETDPIPQARITNQHLAETNESGPSGSEENQADTAGLATSALVDGQEPVMLHSPEASSTLDSYPHGRFVEGLGRPLPSQVSAGDVVS